MKKRVRACAVVLQKEKILLVALKDPISQVTRLFPPGGKIEIGETPIEAAQRETEEETGYQIRMDPDTERLSRYVYRWADRDYDCETFFFRGVLSPPVQNPSPPEDADYNMGCSWVSLPEAEKVLSYHLDIQRTVLELCNG